MIYFNLSIIRYKRCKGDLHSIFENVENISLTTDLWKKKQKYFLALTTHFFDKNLQYHSILLSFRKFSKYHDSDKLSIFLTKELGGLLNKVCLLFTVFILFYYKQLRQLQ